MTFSSGVAALVVGSLAQLAACQDKYPAFALFNAADPGVRMPAIGLGTGAYRASSNPAPEVYPECWNTAAGCGGAVSKAVSTWLQMGGPRLDCANSYDDEPSVGQGIAASGVPRERFFVLSKTGPPFPLGYNDTISQAEGILADLGIDYVDALLIHWPYETQSQGNSTNNVTTSSDPACNMTSPSYDPRACRLSTWRAMVHLWHSGKARSIGVSNYNISCLQEIIDAGLPLPAINQCPYNLYRSSSQEELRAWCTQHKIVFNGYSPLGVPDWHAYPTAGTGLAATPLLDPLAIGVAKAHPGSTPAQVRGREAADSKAHPGSTPAQVLLAWQLALGIPTNPRTFNASHMKDNLDAVAVGSGLRLTHAEVAALSRAPQDTCAMDPSFYECAP